MFRLVCLTLLLIGVAFAQGQKKDEGLNLNVPSADAVRFNFNVLDNALEICKESPWSERACLRFENLPEREAEHLKKWFHRPAEAAK